MPGSILGNRVVRHRPGELGHSVEVVDVHAPGGQERRVLLAFARSAVAHGTITSIDIDEAEAMPGVLGVFTASGLGLEPAPSPFNPAVTRYLIASDRVRHVGAIVAAVVAETREQ